MEKHNLSNRINHITRSKTSEVRILANRLREQGFPIINLAAGELTCDTASIFKIAAINAINNGCNLYTDTGGIPSLRRELANRISKQLIFEYSPDQIIVTTGAKQALFHCAVTLLEPGDEVLIPSPYWNTYASQAILMGAKPVTIDISNQNFYLTTESVRLHLSDRTKLLILNSPNNPTGKVFHPNIIRELAEMAVEYNFWIAFDASYSDLIYDDSLPPLLGLSGLTAKAYERLIVISSFSKAYALTGWRIGYMATSKVIARASLSLQSHTTSNANAIAQHAVLAAFSEEADAFLALQKKYLIEKRSIGLEILSKNTLLHPIIPDGGFYFYCRIDHKKLSDLLGENNADTEHLTKYLLEQAHVAVTPGTAFGDSTGIRISFSVNRDDFVEGLQRITAILS